MDFEGHRVGILTGTNTEFVYRTLVNELHLDKKKIHEVEAPFDIASFITSNAYDVRPAYVYDEPVSLDLKNIKYNMIEPRNYGVRFVGTVYFTKRSTIEKNEQMVRNFVASVADGWKAALKYPDAAIKLLKEYDANIDSNRERLSFDKGRSYFSGKNGKILWAEPDDWEQMTRSLQKLGVLKPDFQVSHSIDNSFLMVYYANEEKK